uniref:aldose 1-epimerase n=1 Tax=Ciona intestinalis TaxID=7719 RepID=UPI0000521D4D|nr:aldose 1-epimerase [Ciona intestinalis]|eukprot:XP_002125905.1 aldose 1-epimerase [Ciona intestinalis]
MGHVKCSEFGKTKNGQVVNLYELKSNHVELGLINYGATIAYLKVPDRFGKRDDIVTGFDNLEDYLSCKNYFGCVVGRVANRIGEGKFHLNGQEWVVDVNNGPNCNHGGSAGFDTKVWECTSAENNSVTFRLESPHGDMGFPGDVVVTVTYILHNNELEIKYKGTSNQPTPMNLTNHANFNLGGHSKWENFCDHFLNIPADHYLPTDEHCLVTGDMAPSEKTDFNLKNEPRKLTQDFLLNLPGGGYDHNFCLTRDKTKKLAAVLTHAGTSRVLKVYTDQPGIQVYTGNFLNGMKGKQGVKYTKHSAICLETQNWPNAINNPNFPDSICTPDTPYSHNAWFEFATGSCDLE